MMLIIITTPTISLFLTSSSSSSSSRSRRRTDSWGGSRSRSRGQYRKINAVRTVEILQGLLLLLLHRWFLLLRFRCWKSRPWQRWFGWDQYANRRPATMLSYLRYRFRVIIDLVVSMGVMVVLLLLLHRLQLRLLRVCCCCLHDHLRMFRFVCFWSDNNVIDPHNRIEYHRRWCLCQGIHERRTRKKA